MYTVTAAVANGHICSCSSLDEVGTIRIQIMLSQLDPDPKHGFEVNFGINAVLRYSNVSIFLCIM